MGAEKRSLEDAALDCDAVIDTKRARICESDSVTELKDFVTTALASRDAWKTRAEKVAADAAALRMKLAAASAIDLTAASEPAKEPNPSVVPPQPARAPTEPQRPPAVPKAAQPMTDKQAAAAMKRTVSTTLKTIGKAIRKQLRYTNGGSIVQGKITAEQANISIEMLRLMFPDNAAELSGQPTKVVDFCIRGEYEDIFMTPLSGRADGFGSIIVGQEAGLRAKYNPKTQTLKLSGFSEYDCGSY